jgi:hypothetical protein
MCAVTEKLGFEFFLSSLCDCMIQCLDRWRDPPHE